MPPALLFILKIALSIWDLLWFSTNYRNVYYYEKCHWKFDKNYIESVD